MARKNKTYREMVEMAKSYGVENNAMFLTALNQYCTQQKVIETINKVLLEEDSLITTKEYVKNRENVYAHPLIRELPKHSDAANRTASVILDIIKTLGHKKSTTGGKLDELLNAEDDE